MNIRRLLIALVTLALTAAVAPAGARPPSCWPVPDAACPPDAVVPPRIPQIGFLPAPVGPVVNGAITSVNTTVADTVKPIPLPVYNAWPDTNITILGDAAGATVYAPVSDNTVPLPVRYGGNLYIQNLTLNVHTVTDAACVGEQGGVTGSCRFRVGIEPLNAGIGARFLSIAPGTFERNKSYAFRCEVHPTLMRGTLVTR